jgi:hypothetical protein
MSKKILLAMCLSTLALVLGLPTAASAVVWNTATSPPDTTASVNANPNGLWSTATQPGALNSQAASAAAGDGYGCPSLHGCGWVNSQFGTPMGQWAGPNAKFSIFGQPNCQEGNWNDCISSIDNNGSQCRINWWWDIGHNSGNVWRLNRGYAYSNLNPDPAGRNANDKFSSDDWC